MQITTIPDGQVVRKNGAYRMSMAHYHSQCCAGPSISSSGLRKIWDRGAWAFWSESDLNPDRYPASEIEKDAFILGRAAHSLILGDEVFSDAFTYYPKDAPQRPTATQIAAFERDGEWSEKASPRAAFWEKFDREAAGKTMLSETQVEAILRMAENIQRNPLAMEMLTGGLTEVSTIWQDEITGVWIKSRPDVLPDNGADAADLKTFSARGSNMKLAVQRSITDRGYHQQMALAQEGAERVFGVSASEFVLVFVETTIPHEVVPVRLDEESLHIGRIQNRHALDTFARCMKSGEWPGIVEGVMDYQVPPSIAGRIYDLQANGELPNV